MYVQITKMNSNLASQLVSCQCQWNQGYGEEEKTPIQPAIKKIIKCMIQVEFIDILSSS